MKCLVAPIGRKDHLNVFETGYKLLKSVIFVICGLLVCCSIAPDMWPFSIFFFYFFGN